MAEVRLESVTKYYGEVQAVKNLNLVCPDGAMVALLGPSGCGKTSTLKMLAGIEEVSEGEIWFDDRPVSRLAPAERNIAMVFEDYALYPHLTAFENIAFPLRIRGFSGEEIKRRVHQVLDLLLLNDIRDERASRLSGGAQQRISIGRALVRDPELILFDEPLSHLDGDQKVQLRSEIKRLQQTTGLSAVLVTHDQTEAVAMSDLVAIMDQGVLQQVGPPEDLYHFPANLFVAKFIGEPPMNLLAVEITEEAGTLVLAGKAGWKIGLRGKMASRIREATRSPDAILGVRPEHLRIADPSDNNRQLNRHPGRIWWRERRGDVEVVFVDMLGSKTAGATSERSTLDEILVEVPSPSPYAEGDIVDTVFDPDSISLFESSTGRNVLAAQGSGEVRK
jgi:multiple sugar transport system ATP-binding protein